MTVNNKMVWTIVILMLIALAVLVLMASTDAQLVLEKFVTPLWHCVSSCSNTL